VDWYLVGGHLNRALLPVRRGLYDAELALADAALGQLLDLLADRRLLDASVVVVTSDHGENLGDHGHQGHAFSLYGTTLRVPLAIRLPDAARAGERRPEPVQLSDVHATLLARAELEAADPRAVGRDLLAAPPAPDRPLIAEYAYPRQFLAAFPDTETAAAATAPYRRQLRAVRVGAHKLVWASDGRHELYDVRRDPAERRDLAATHPERVAALERRLADTLTRLAAPPPAADEVPDLDAETRRSLRALGYLR
jgi:arylsulfatase A-like enzyme